MGAPSAPPEEPQVTPEPTEPVAEPETTPSPPAEGGDEPEQEAGSGLDLKEILKGATVAELRQVLESVPQETRTELEAEIERRGEQRAKTRGQEKATAQSARQAAFTQQKAVGEAANAWLAQQTAKAEAGDFDALPPAMLKRAAVDLKAAGVAENALAIEAEISPLLDKYLPELTDEEQKKLDKPLYDDARTGGVSHVPVLIELAIERAKADAFAEGVKKGEGNLAARNALVEKLQNAQKIKKETAGVAPNGRAAVPSDVRRQIVDEINAIDPFRDPQAQEKLDALRYKLRAL